MASADEIKVKEYDDMSRALMAWFESQGIEPAMAATVMVYAIAHLAAERSKTVHEAIDLLSVSHKSMAGICIAQMFLKKFG